MKWKLLLVAGGLAMPIIGAAIDLVGPVPADATPRLSAEAVEAAVLKNFPDLQAASAAVDVALGEQKNARLPPDPSLELGRVRTRPLDGSPSGSNSFYSVEWELPMPWRYAAGRNLASKNLLTARAEYRNTELDVRARIRGLIVDLATSEEKVTLLGAQQKLAGGLAGLAATRKELGEGRELDRLRTQVESAGVERELELARADRIGLRDTLARLSGGRLPRDFFLAQGLTNDLPVIAPADLEQSALASSPLLRKLGAEAEAARAAVTLERSEASPTLALQGGRSGDLDTRATSVSIMFKVPLWNANRGMIAAAVGRRAEAEARLEGAQREIAARTATAAARYVSLLTISRRFSTEILPAAQKARDISDFAYRQGEISLIEALDARRSFQAVAQESLEARQQLHHARIELESLGALPIPPLAAETASSEHVPATSITAPEARQ